MYKKGISWVLHNLAAAGCSGNVARFQMRSKWNCDFDRVKIFSEFDQDLRVNFLKRKADFFSDFRAIQPIDNRRDLLFPFVCAFSWLVISNILRRFV